MRSKATPKRPPLPLLSTSITCFTQHHIAMDRPHHPIVGPASPSPSPSTATTTSNAPPITYVHTDQTTFKELVQRLTGPPSAAAAHHHHHPPPPPPAAARRPGSSKLRPKLTIVKPAPSHPFSQGRLSPSSAADVAGLYIRDIESPSSAATAAAEGVVINEEEEERAIRERRFYLHPSPRSRAGGPAGDAAEPELLPLFPLTSPNGRSG